MLARRSKTLGSDPRSDKLEIHCPSGRVGSGVFHALDWSGQSEEVLRRHTKGQAHDGRRYDARRRATNSAEVLDHHGLRLCRRKGACIRFACLPSGENWHRSAASTDSGSYAFGAIKDCGAPFEVEFVEAGPLASGSA